MTKYLLLLPTLTGCIIVEGEKSEQSDGNEWDSGWDESESSEDDGTEDVEEETPGPENVDGTYYTVPSEAARERILVCTRSDDAIDWAQIVSITPYGDVTIWYSMPLYDELLLTVKVKDSAPEGTVDLIVEYLNGDIDLVEDGFIIDTNADVGSAATDPSACD